MRGRLLIAVGAGVVGLLIGSAVNATLAEGGGEAAAPEAAYELKNVQVTSFRDQPVEGTVSSRTVPGGRAEVLASLHHLEDESSYVVVGSARACTQDAGPNQAVVWKTQFLTVPGGDDVFQSVRVDRPRPLADINCVRVFRLPDVGPPQLVAKGVAKVGLGVVGQ